MKTMIVLTFGIFSYLCNGQTDELLGSWEIIHFQNNYEGEENITTEAELREQELVWDLEFSEGDKYRQTSNMSGNGKLESQDGTWSIENGQLKLMIQYQGQTLPISYTYSISDGVLELRRMNPMKTMEIISRFKRK